MSEPQAVEELLTQGERLLAQGEAVSAERLASRALSISPGLSPARLLLAKSKAGQGRMEEAEQLIAQLETAEAMATLGVWQQAAGRLEEARANLEESIALEPKQAAAYYYLAQMSCDSTLVQRMEDLLEEPSLTVAERQLLYYAAGKGREELGDYREAMSLYEEANDLLANQQPPFDPATFTAGYDRIIELFPGPLKPIGPSETLPVFIVGMIRSGTTLLEQILYSHSQIGAVGELPFWIQNAGTAIDFATGRLNEPVLTNLASEYLKTLSESNPKSLRVTDKMPANASLLGLIHQALPKAKIIYIRRHPIDNCLSIFITRFETPPPYAGDKGHIALAYRQHARIMDHWQQLLSPDQFTTIEYEELISNREQTVTRLLGFLGLEWEDACLHHEQNPNLVKTPSLWRVRQPVDASSMNRWKNFKPWLGEFKALAP